MPETRPDRLSYTRGALDKLRKAHESLSHEELLDLVCHLTKTYVLEQTIPFDVPMPERVDPSDLPDVPEPSAAAQDDPEATPVRRFARLVEGLKRRANLPQLDGFSVHEGRAVLVVDNQKVTFGERVTIEFVPVRQGATSAVPALDDAPAPAAAPRQPGAPPPAARPAPAPAQQTPAQAPTQRPAPRAVSPGVGASPFEPERPAASRPAGAGRPARPARGPGAPIAPAAHATRAPAPEPHPTQEVDGDDVDQNAIERFKRLELD